MNFLRKFLLCRPMLTCAAGTFLVCVLAFNFRKSLIFLTAILLVLAMYSFLFQKSGKLIIVILGIFAISLSALNTYSKIDKLNSLVGESIKTEFIALSDTKNYESFVSVEAIAVGDSYIPKNTKLSILSFDETNVIKTGDRFIAAVKLSGYNDHKLKEYYYGNGIYASCVLDELVSFKGTVSFLRLIGNVRSFVSTTINKAFSDERAGFLIALTIGDKDYMSADFNNTFKEIGVSHIVVVSGLHLSIILGSLFMLLDRFFYNKYIRCVISAFAVLLIAAICGFTLSIFRAGFMFLISALAPLFKREADSLSSLGLAVVIILFISPFAALSVSFQLSVLATLAIISVSGFYADMVIQKFKITNRLLAEITKCLCISIFAMLFTLPVLVKTFGFVSVITPVSNLLITFPATYSLISTILGLILYYIFPFDFVLKAVFIPAGVFSKLIIIITEFLARLPITTVVTSNFTFCFSIILIIVSIAYMIYSKNK